MGKKFTIKIDMGGGVLEPIKRTKNPETKTKHKKGVIPYKSKRLADNGVVIQEIGMLSSDQKEQEKQLLGFFINFFEKKYEKIIEPQILPIDDYDFSFKLNGSNVVGDFTEIDVVGKVFKAGEGHYISGENVSRLLLDAIEKKRLKPQSKPTNAEFWLILFQTESSFAIHDLGIERTLRHLNSVDEVIYNQIWYLYFYSSEPQGFIRRIWPKN